MLTYFIVRRGLLSTDAPEFFCGVEFLCGWIVA